MGSFGDINPLVHISQFVSHLDKTRAKILVSPNTLMILKKIAYNAQKTLALKQHRFRLSMPEIPTK